MAIATERRADVSVTIGGREITFETGKLAKQADGSVIVRSGDTMVLATAQGRMEPREGADFFPLTVDVEERMYAAGKIPGGFFKREGRPTERAILTARMIDRPIRPLWPKGYKNETQVICTVLSADLITAHDILCINGASAALMLSPMPFLGPVGAVRIAIIDGELVVNPTLPEVEEHKELDLIVVGTPDALTMVEAGANQVSEEKLLEALDLAHDEIRKLCDAQIDLQRQAGKAKWLDDSVTEEVEQEFGDKIRERINSDGLRAADARDRRGARRAEHGLDRGGRPPAGAAEDEPGRTCSSGSGSSSSCSRYASSSRAICGRSPTRSRTRRSSSRRSVSCSSIASSTRSSCRSRSALRSATGRRPTAKDSMTKSYVKKSAEAVYKELVRRKIAVDKHRPDGRSPEEIRPIECEVGVSPRVHGSGLFTRGQTQIMSLLTLGTAKEGQRIDDLSLETDRRFMHHYNFPPYSVGETGFMRGPKRRDIGHGALAQRSLEPVIPPTDEFPYTIRIVSETLESNGSSSMGSVCGSTLALMDAGVPIKAPVSGIAMGLVKEGDDYVILTDIQGAEDHLGDMDFKVAGTREGITGLQMDIKITGVTREIMQAALEQAKRAREIILDKMLEAIPEVRTELNENAPRISTVKIDPEKIGMVIGKGGETIRGLEVRPRSADRHRGGRDDPHLRDRRTEGRVGDRGGRGPDEGAGGRRRVPQCEGRQDDAVRRVRRAQEGNGRTCSTSRTSGRAVSVTSRTSSIAATSSTCSCRRSTRLAAGSASS